MSRTPREFPMTVNALAQLETTNRTVKRAQYEAFEFQLVDDGVLVRNESHEQPSEHEYRVRVDAGVPATCECPADEHYENACKHRIAVAIRKPILEAASTPQVAADGGVATQQDESTPENCDCDELPDEFPCWECVRTGRRNLPSEKE